MSDQTQGHLARQAGCDLSRERLVVELPTVDRGHSMDERLRQVTPPRDLPGFGLVFVPVPDPLSEPKEDARPAEPGERHELPRGDTMPRPFTTSPCFCTSTSAGRCTDTT